MEGCGAIFKGRLFAYVINLKTNTRLTGGKLPDETRAVGQWEQGATRARSGGEQRLTAANRRDVQRALGRWM